MNQSIAVTRPGAVPSVTYRAEVEEALKSENRIEESESHVATKGYMTFLFFIQILHFAD